MGGGRLTSEKANMEIMMMMMLVMMMLTNGDDDALRFNALASSKPLRLVSLTGAAVPFLRKKGCQFGRF